jgi:hypothetical protein
MIIIFLLSILVFRPRNKHEFVETFKCEEKHKCTEFSVDTHVKEIISSALTGHVIDATNLVSKIQYSNKRGAADVKYVKLLENEKVIFGYSIERKSYEKENQTTFFHGKKTSEVVNVHIYLIKAGNDVALNQLKELSGNFSKLQEFYEENFGRNTDAETNNHAREMDCSIFNK